jgi:hypothetical protein
MVKRKELAAHDDIGPARCEEPALVIDQLVEQQVNF